MFHQLPFSDVVIWHLPFVQLCYGVTATSLFHSMHHSGMPLPFILLIDENIHYLLQFRESFFAGFVFGAVVEM